MASDTLISSMTYKGINYSERDINIMLDWLKDLTFADEVDFDELTSMQIVVATNRHHDGGLSTFDLSV